MAFLLTPTISSPKPISAPHSFFPSPAQFPFLHFLQPQKEYQFFCKTRNKFVAPCTSYEVGGGYADSDNSVKDRINSKTQGQDQLNQKLATSEYEAIIKGGEQVTSVLEEMITLLEDTGMDEASEEVAVQLAAQGVIGKRVDQMESGFMMALDYMIQQAEKDEDDQRKTLLEVVKETVLSHLTKKCPPHVQVIGLLCRTPQKESRNELLRRVAAGGGEFKSKNGTKVHLPGANLNDIANQADDLLETMESRPFVPDRKLLARLVLIREEARNMMGGGILDERNDRGFSTLPESEVNFLTKLVALRPGKTVLEMIKNVMEGKAEGADNASGDEENNASGKTSGGIAGRVSIFNYMKSSREQVVSAGAKPFLCVQACFLRRYQRFWEVYMLEMSLALRLNTLSGYIRRLFKFYKR